MSEPMTAYLLRVLLARYRLSVIDEDSMQRAIALVLEAEGVSFEREVRRGRDRIDFLVGRVGVECKVDGPVSALIRQLARYSLWEELDELLVVTSVDRHKLVSDSLNGKSVLVHIARGAQF